MQSICNKMECMDESNSDINGYINSIKSAIGVPYLPEIVEKYPFSAPTPLEILYLRLIQHEYLGQMKDLLTLYDLQANREYSIPEEYINDMREFQAKEVCNYKFDEYFEVENVQRIAKYVYLKSKTDKEERRKIRECKEEVFRLLNFYSLAYPETNIMNELTELLIISCLQAILLDKDEKIFDYTFNGFEGKDGKRIGKISMLKALKGNEHVYDALQVYWIHRVKNHMYANIGKYDLRKSIRDVEKLCVEVLEKILNCPTIEKMLSVDNFYYHRPESVRLIVSAH